MIRYKDFAPQVAKRGPFGGPAKIEPFSSAVNAANQWIENSSVQFVNIETVFLPDIGVASEGAYTAQAYGGGSILWYQCVRIWYRG